MIYISELLFRMVYICISFCLCFIIAFQYHPFFIQFFLQYTKYISSNNTQIVFLSIFESLQCAINISIYFSFICLTPYLFYTIWHWFSNAIYQKERYFLNISLLFSFVTFLFNQILGIFYFYPILLKFLANFQSNQIINHFSLFYFVNSFLNIQFILFLLSSLILIFIYLLLAQIINPSFQLRKWTSFFLFLFAAFICPPDFISQLCFWLFCQLIFEIVFSLGCVLKHYQYKTNKMMLEHLNIEENINKQNLKYYN